MGGGLGVGKFPGRIIYIFKKLYSIQDVTFLCQKYSGFVREPGTGLHIPLFVPEHQTVSRPGVPPGVPPDVVPDQLPSGPAPVRVRQSVAA